MTDDLEFLRKRLAYRAHHRGTKEMDMVFGSFADAHLTGFDAAELARFEQLLEESDADVLNWVTGQAPLPETNNADLIAALVAYAKTGLAK